MIFNMLVFTLLIFDIYPKIIELNLSSLFIIQYTIAMKKTIDKVQKYTVS